MKLKDLYASRKLTLSIEFFPPRTPETIAKFFNNIPAFKSLKPAFCSVTMGAGGGLSDKTVDLVKQLKRDYGIETMCHFTCVGKSRDEVRSILEELKVGGIENIIALRGDPPKGETEWRPHPDGFKYSVELIKEAQGYGWFSIAVAGFPEIHPEAVSPEADLDYLKAKLDAGADVVITQLFFDNDDYFRFVERAQTAGMTAPIVPGILPIKSVAWVRKFLPMIKAKIPPALEAALVRCEGNDEATIEMGIEYATRQCRGLLEYGVPGMHFYSLNEPRAVTAIFRSLGLY